MKTMNLTQGSPEWIEHRRTSRNASEASIIMGCHPNCSRSELIRLKARGAEQEFSDWVRKNILDKGHAVEAKARPMIERELYAGDELYPVCGQSDDGKLCASFDGLPMIDVKPWECKQYNAAKFADVLAGAVPECDKWQVVQQSYVAGKVSVYYTVTDGTDEKTETIEYEPNEEEYQRLLLAWDQFEADLAAYDASNDIPPKPEGVTPETLPALHVEATGKVLTSNLDAYRDHAMQVLGSINRDLKTDQDFSDAEQTVKWCKSVESKLSAAKDSVLGQMATVDEVCRTIDDLSAETRRVRLDLDKLVKAEKERRKSDIINTAVESVREHCSGINASLDDHALQSDQHRWQRDIATAIKGLKTLSSITDAADTAAANLKIEASQQADRIRAAVAVLDEFSDHAGLFADRVQLCREKSPEDLRNLAKARVAEHVERERQRIEAERQQIRAEEQEKAEQVAKEQARKTRNAAPITAPPPRDPTPVEVAATGAVEKAKAIDDRLIKLGDIQKAIAPLSITAEGLHTLCGIQPTKARNQKGAAKFYRVADVMIALSEMQNLVDRATPDVERYAKEAA